MKLEELVKLAKAGKLRVSGGQRGKTSVIENFTTMDDKDVEGLTAEAYNLDALPANLPWENGLAQVKAAILSQ